ncbi:hypothetical protein Tco_0762824 [Tanacetum coccineum]
MGSGIRTKGVSGEGEIGKGGIGGGGIGEGGSGEGGSDNGDDEGHSKFLSQGAARSFAAPRSSRSHIGSHFPTTILLSSLDVAFLLPILATCILFLAC